MEKQNSAINRLEQYSSGGPDNEGPDKPKKTDIRSLPKHHPDRDAVAWQLREGRFIDRSGVWVDNRNGSDYVHLLQGLSGTLDYVRNFLKSQVVLDVGTGSSIGLNEIARSRLGQGLEFRATSLTARPEQKRNLGKEKITLTSAELLRGIPDNSIGLILGLHSFEHSDRPELIAARLDQVLVEGGLVKAVFTGENTKTSMGKLSSRAFKKFTQLFYKLGYSVTSKEIVNKEEKTELMLALKPYTNLKVGASFPDSKNILEADESIIQHDLKTLKEA